jgi:putative FmdB family regulatory protein
MPIYAYACKQCNHEFDALQKISDAPLTDCPECGEPALKRLLSAPRFRLKGQGWYETDFKTENQRNIHGEKEPKKDKDKPSGDKPPGDKPPGGKDKKPASKDTKKDTA